MQTHTRPTQPRGRLGFTLVELLIVVTIIAILAGLLTTALFPIFGRTGVAQAKTDIGGFDNAIADFKVKFGKEPPSSIRLSEDGNWNADAKAKLRTIFGNQVVLDTSATYDFNGDSDTNDQIDLNGAQCLVFFLGGPISGGDVQGFSKNPRYPFKLPASLDEERIRFYEFDPQRLENINGQIGTYAAKDNFGSFLYIRKDDYSDTLDGMGNPTGAIQNVVGNAAFTGAYRLPGGSYHKPRSYQIFTAGPDNDFGIGGNYDPNNPDSVGEQDRDNVANFAAGQLAP